jgi:hypothetical protein
VNAFATGLGADGIHPTIAGQRLMGQEAARVLAPVVAASSGPHIEAIRPASGATSGETVVAITGANFVAGMTLTIGGVPVTQLQVLDSGNVTGTTGARDPGPADVVVTNPDGRSAALAAGFTYVSSPSVSAAFGSSGCSSSGPASWLLIVAPVLLFTLCSRIRRRRTAPLA